MNLDGAETAAAYYAVAGFVRHLNVGQRAIPPEVGKLYQRLDAQIRLSCARHESSCATVDRPPSETWIGAAATASMLQRGLRYVQRHAEEIGGQLVGGRYLFRESDVIDYLERQHSDRTQPGN
ncbi:hypothetical protein ACWDUN_03985 [Mycobacterium sp. NPDC003323]